MESESISDMHEGAVVLNGSLTTLKHTDDRVVIPVPPGIADETFGCVNHFMCCHSPNMPSISTISVLPSTSRSNQYISCAAFCDIFCLYI